MPAKITLTIIQGKFVGRKYVFVDRSTCIVGRDASCHPRLPNDALHRKVSRSHCLLDINPPDIRVRDFGSRNGTFVNGTKIGQRGLKESRERGRRKHFREYDLQHGDEIRLGNTTFKVGIFVPALCSSCGKEGALPRTGARNVGAFLCAECKKKQAPPSKRSAVVPSRSVAAAGRSAVVASRSAVAASRSAALAKERVCVHCGKDVSAEMGEYRQGEFVCGTCQSDPAMLMQALLDLAHQRSKDVAAIKGYRIIRKLGQGSMGAVFLARTQRGDGEDVALKLMLPQVALDDRCKDMFLRETENARALKHPNIVGLREAGCARGIFFFVMDYCEQGGADRLLRERGKLPPAEAVPIICQVLDGLDYAHQAEIPHLRGPEGTTAAGRGMIHRDLKPANILFASFAGIRMTRIGDFGLARAFDQAGLSGLTCTGGRMDAPLFMPRQQVVNYKYASPDVDVWAAAACLYNLLTGAAPRDFTGNKDPFMVVLNTNPVPILERDPSIPRKLADVLDAALREERGKPLQFETAAQLKKALQEAM